MNSLQFVVVWVTEWSLLFAPHRKRVTVFTNHRMPHYDGTLAAVHRAVKNRGIHSLFLESLSQTRKLQIALAFAIWTCSNRTLGGSCVPFSTGSPPLAATNSPRCAENSIFRRVLIKIIAIETKVPRIEPFPGDYLFGKDFIIFEQLVITFKFLDVCLCFL